MSDMALPNLTSVDLERLVTWAIRDQKGDRDDMGLHRVEMAAQIAVRQRRRGGEAFDYPAAYPMDSVARAMEIGDIGTRIDGGGQIRGVPPRLHPDAEVVMDAINGMRDFRRKRAVLLFGRSGERPEWLPWEQRLKAVEVPETQRGRYRHRIDGEWQRVPERTEVARMYLAAGLPAVDQRGRGILERIEREERRFTFDRDGEGHRRQFVKWCVVEPSPSVDQIRSVNEVYAEWHAGMKALLAVLSGALLRAYRLTGFHAPAAPWDASGG
ncbi:MAG TPA: hypothetical protein VD995_04580 [Azospirillum sp.]|nr:hypothetical protein [Azospirillum sp.]